MRSRSRSGGRRRISLRVIRQVRGTRRSAWRRIRLPAVLAGLALGLVVVAVVAVRRADTPTEPADRATLSRNPPTRIEARQIPLPPGDWRVLSRIPAEGEESAAPFASMVLARLNGREVDAAVLVQVNRLGHRVTWGLPEACLLDDFAPRRIQYASDHDGSCSYASFTDGTGPLTGVLIDPAWHRAMREAVDRGWNVPVTWLSVTFRVTDPMDALQIRYLFHPWDIGQAKPPESAAWRRIQADRLAIWMEAAAPRVGAGFRDRLRSAYEATLPDPMRPEVARPEIAARNGAPPTTLEVEADESTRAMIARAMSYRMFASIADFGVLWLYLGNAVTASTLAALKLATQGAASVTYEYMKSRLVDPIPRHDLPNVGVERPLPR